MAPGRARAAGAGVATALLVGLLLWLVTGPDDDDEEQGAPSTTTTGVTAPASTAPSIPEPGGSEEIGITQGQSIFTADDATVEADLDHMADIGVGWLRVDLDWSAIETSPGTFDWSTPDGVIERAQQRGIRILALPTYTPAWARPPGTDDKHAPDDPAAFGQFVLEAARRYVPRGIVHWEIWNEANSDAFYGPAPDPVGYSRLLVAAAGAVRRVEPDAVVLTSGTSPAVDRDDGSTISPATFLEGVYDEAGADAFDAVAHHPYSYPLRPTQPDPLNSFAAVVPELRRIMDERGDDDVELWATEFGAPTGDDERAVDPDEQAAYLREGIEAWLDTPGTGPIFWYAWRDSGTDPGDREQNFGVLRADGTPKPALATLERVIAARCEAEPAACEGGTR